MSDDTTETRRWELMGDPLGRLVVVGGTDPTGLDVGQTVWVVPEAEVERLREENKQLRESRDAWRLQAMREHDEAEAPVE